MTRRNPPAKWVLPSVIDPPKRRCFVIEVPDEELHIAAFRGALLNLASAYKWADDPAHTAREVALVWRTVVEAVKECQACPPQLPDGGIILEDLMSQQIRISPDDSCIIQMWCIDHWEDWYDPRVCIAKGASQEGPRGTLGAGECQEFDVVLQANSLWKLPVPVKNGDVITITQSSGGWYDPDSGAFWNCPDGSRYSLGICSGFQTNVGTDPVTSAYHMALVAKVGAIGYTAHNQIITVSGQTGSVDVTFQANDSNIGNDAGSVSFHVKVCNGQPNTVNFTFSNNANGPASLQIGQEDWFNFPVFDGSAWNGGIFMDKCCNMTLVAQSGATVTQADWKDCGGATHTGFNLTGVTKVGCNSTIGAFSLKLRLDSIV